MASQEYVRHPIEHGPSKWDFFLSLADGTAESTRRKVCFSVNTDRGLVEIHGYVVRVDRMGEGDSKWWFVISVTAAPPILDWKNWEVEGEFNTHTRKGYFREEKVEPNRM